MSRELTKDQSLSAQFTFYGFVTFDLISKSISPQIKNMLEQGRSSRLLTLVNGSKLIVPLVCRTGFNKCNCHNSNMSEWSNCSQLLMSLISE